MTDYEPESGFRAALTRIDLGEADLIVTPSAAAAEWAGRHGYRIVHESSPDGLPVYEIWAGRDRPPVDGAVATSEHADGQGASTGETTIGDHAEPEADHLRVGRDRRR